MVVHNVGECPVGLSGRSQYLWVYGGHNLWSAECIMGMSCGSQCV